MTHGGWCEKQLIGRDFETAVLSGYTKRPQITQVWRARQTHEHGKRARNAKSYCHEFCKNHAPAGADKSAPSVRFFPMSGVSLHQSRAAHGGVAPTRRCEECAKSTMDGCQPAQVCALLVLGSALQRCRAALIQRFSELRSMVPDWRAISLPLLNSTMVGRLRMPKRLVRVGFSSVLTLATWS